MRAKIMRFYGITLSAYDRMSIKVRDELWEAITVIEAQDCMTQMTIAMYPKLKHADREKLHKEFHKKAYPAVHKRARRTITAEELQARLSKGRP